ncbi:MerR family transcriptional regulator [Rhizobium oryzicola]|uniref:MerR family transcriptional regulator n=1 Tax=Rhizobium oryzicola TaxID=1232668 RepID=A0ABT8T2B5_9HYPH|nr:MerR family transcriptional regulator [Rhizobium oryzicola]MDO1584433.1 MerR family transcriptional regulator [Rhizobium oryzicola]
MQQNLFDAQPSSGEGRQQILGFMPQIAAVAKLPAAPLAIADMAEAFGVTHRTLHFYEEKGLLAPERLGSMRVYNAQSIQRMAVINACREVGVPLSSIQELMTALETAGSQEEADLHFRTLLDTRRRELTSDVSTLHRQIQQIRTLIIDIGNQPQETQRVEARRPDISDMERKCLALMVEGYKGRELATALEITEAELEDLEDGLMVKLEAANRSQAAAKAVILGILPH